MKLYKGLSNLSPDFWFTWQHRNDKFIYNYVNHKTHCFSHSNADTFMTIDFVQLDENMYNSIKLGKATENEIRYIYDFYLNEVNSFPESNAARLRNAINSYGALVPLKNKSLENEKQSWFFDSFILLTTEEWQTTEEMHLLGKQTGPDRIVQNEYVFSECDSTVRSEPAGIEMIDDSAFIQMKAVVKDYNDTFGFTGSMFSQIDEFKNAKPGDQIKYLRAGNSRLDFILTKVTQSDYVECQFMEIADQPNINQESADDKLKRYREAITEDPAMFDVFLDSSNFKLDCPSGTFGAYTQELFPEFSKILLDLGIGEIGYTEKTRFGYYIIRAKSIPIKKDHQFWFKAKFYRYQN